MPAKKFLALAVAWLIVVLVAIAGRAMLLESPISPTEYGAWILLACAPITIAVIIARSASPRTIAQVLYEAERAPEAGKESRS